mmetsp:Transcript_39797/g.118489  ORF Transcript_39797/g.118489 Transcript_39797/m.118489 type:complete len:377 (+) Transcript_39797:886-2016(+)
MVETAVARLRRRRRARARCSDAGAVRRCEEGREVVRRRRAHNRRHCSTCRRRHRGSGLRPWPRRRRRRRRRRCRRAPRLHLAMRQHLARPHLHTCQELLAEALPVRDRHLPYTSSRVQLDMHVLIREAVDVAHSASERPAATSAATSAAAAAVTGGGAVTRQAAVAAAVLAKPSPTKSLDVPPACPAPTAAPACALPAARTTASTAAAATIQAWWGRHRHIPSGMCSSDARPDAVTAMPAGCANAAAGAMLWAAPLTPAAFALATSLCHPVCVQLNAMRGEAHKQAALGPSSSPPRDAQHRTAAVPSAARLELRPRQHQSVSLRIPTSAAPAVAVAATAAVARPLTSFRRVRTRIQRARDRSAAEAGRRIAARGGC